MARPSHRLADLREHVEEDEDQQERLDQGPQGELDQRAFATPSGPAASRAYKAIRLAAMAESQRARSGRFPGRSPWPGRAPGAGLELRSSVAQVLAGEVDEYGLQRGLGNREVEHEFVPAPFRRGDHRGEQPEAAASCGGPPPSTSPGLRFAPRGRPEGFAASRLGAPARLSRRRSCPPPLSPLRQWACQGQGLGRCP